MEQKQIKLTVIVNEDDLHHAAKNLMKRIKDVNHGMHPIMLAAIMVAAGMSAGDSELCNINLDKNPSAQEVQRILESLIFTQLTKDCNISREEFERLKKEHENRGGDFLTYLFPNRFVSQKRTELNPNRDLNLSRFVILAPTTKDIKICKHCG